MRPNLVHAHVDCAADGAGLAIKVGWRNVRRGAVSRCDYGRGRLRVKIPIRWIYELRVDCQVGARTVVWTDGSAYQSNIQYVVMRNYRSLRQVSAGHAGPKVGADKQVILNDCLA